MSINSLTITIYTSSNLIRHNHSPISLHHHNNNTTPLILPHNIVNSNIEYSKPGFSIQDMELDSIDKSSHVDADKQVKLDHK
jgi:hypothetical protein